MDYSLDSIDSSEPSQDDLDLLRKRINDRALASQMANRTDPQSDMWAKLMGQGLNLLSNNSAASMAPVQTVTGIKMNTAPTNAGNPIIDAINSKNTALRQKALDDTTTLKTIETLANAKQDRALKDKTSKATMLEKGVMEDENGNLIPIPGGALEAAINLKKAQADYASGRNDVAENKMDFSKNTQLEKQQNMIHDRVVGRIQKDPVLTKQFTQYSNLNNALTNFANAPTATPQAFDELQQAVRSNLGIKAGSAVGERERTTMNSLGLNTDRMIQFLTGNPQDIARDAGFAKHIKDLAALEQKNIRSQVDKRINTLSAGHASMYKSRPDLRDDLNSLTETASSAYAPSAQTESQGSQPVSGGVKMQAPDGSIRMIPADKVEAAKAAGGKLL